MTTEKYLSCAETAKYARKLLKDRFPGQKFSVRSSVYAGGASIHVTWIDGPTTDEVDGTIGYLAGAGFDSSIDLQYYERHWLLPDGTIVYGGTEGTAGSLGQHGAVKVTKPHPDAVQVHLGAHYISTERDYSPAWLTEQLTVIAAKYGMHVPAITVSDYDGSASYSDYWLDETGTRQYYDQSEYHWLYQDLRQISAFTRPEPAKAAAQAPTQEAGDWHVPVRDPSYTVEQDRDWTWIKFASKPADKILEALHALGARWSKRREAWYITRPVVLGEVATAIGI